jgi:thiosulfate reductase cytochrome b subunit
MVSGFLYWGYNSWKGWGLDFLSMELVAFVHMAGAFAIFSFIIVHIYMITTGHTIFAHTKAIISGWEEVPESVEIEDWEKARQEA